jgi:hypothetical protein
MCGADRGAPGAARHAHMGALRLTATRFRDRPVPYVGPARGARWPAWATTIKATASAAVLQMEMALPEVFLGRPRFEHSEWALVAGLKLLVLVG